MLPTDWPLYQGKLVLAALLCLGFAAARPLVERSSQCRKAEVAIMYTTAYPVPDLLLTMMTVELEWQVLLLLLACHVPLFERAIDPC